MASPEEITPLVPDTLPEDFGEWDGESSGGSAPTKSQEWDEWESTHTLGKTPKKPGQTSERAATLSPVVDKPRDTRWVSPVPVVGEQPKDLSDWESKTPRTPSPSKSSEWEEWESAHSTGKPAKPPGQAAGREAKAPAPAEKPRDAWAALPAPAIVKQPKPAGAAADGLASRASQKVEAGHAASKATAAPSWPSAAVAEKARSSPDLSKARIQESDDALRKIFTAENLEAKAKPKTAKPKPAMIAAICAGAVLVPAIVIVPLLHHGTKTAAQPSNQPISGATATSLEMNMSNTTAADSSTQRKGQAANGGSQATDNQPSNQSGANPGLVQTNMMNDQLNAPKRIPKQVAENGPPPASLSGADALGGSGGTDSVFHGNSQPVVKGAPAKPLVISSGVASGMLIQKTAPAYPSIAKAARVSGTVELHATISKDGRIKDLQVINGPAMLRQSAVDAVRTWRYRPYKLNNEPTEVETTVFVTFSLGV